MQNTFRLVGLLNRCLGIQNDNETPVLKRSKASFTILTRKVASPQVSI